MYPPGPVNVWFHFNTVHLKNDSNGCMLMIQNMLKNVPAALTCTYYKSDDPNDFKLFQIIQLDLNKWYKLPYCTILSNKCTGHLDLIILGTDKRMTLLYFNTVIRWTRFKTVKKVQVEIGLSLVFLCTNKYMRNVL